MSLRRPMFSLNIEGNDVIRQYFYAGYTNAEICQILNVNHGFVISVRTVKRILRNLGLRRRAIDFDEQVVIRALQDELAGSGGCLGYRSMQRRLLSFHGLNVPRDAVMILLREMDPIIVSPRRVHRFQRRQYVNKGPNYLVHLDGYDKLKQFGFAIHGGICGFSRKIPWLKEGRTNNNPYVVAHHFMEYIENIGGVQRCIRMDRGTENVFIEDIQKAFRWNHVDNMAGDRSFLYGSSHRNQRIERWWLTLRQSGVNYWINLMKDLESQGLLSTDDGLQIECLRFCFTELLQAELDRICREWNQHRVGASNTADERVCGKPDLLFYLPEVYGTVDYKIEVEERDIKAIKDMCVKPSCCEEHFERTCNRLLVRHHRTKPKTEQEALDLYRWLLSTLQG